MTSWRRRWRRWRRRAPWSNWANIGVALLAGVVVAFMGLVMWSTQHRDHLVEVTQPDAIDMADHSQALLVIGDSWVTGGEMNEGPTWPSLLDLPDDWVLRTDAVGGNGYVGFTRGNDLRTSGRLDTLLSTYGPDVVLVALGRNDILHPVARVVREARFALTAMRDAWPQAQIVALSPWSPTAPQPNTVELTAAMRDLAGDLGMDFLDVSRAIGGSPDLIGSDLNHPNDAGYRELARFVTAGLARLGIAPFGR